MARKANANMNLIVLDGNLDQAEALRVLRTAAQRATEALPKAIEKCTNDVQRQTVIGDRDTIVLAYLTCLTKSLQHTGPLFERLAADLESASKKIKKKATNLRNANEAINLFADVVRLAGSLALAFAGAGAGAVAVA